MFLATAHQAVTQPAALIITVGIAIAAVGAALSLYERWRRH
ncbi:hypothetical protein [Streptacidiphilus sp. PAMC 29251]